MIVGTYIHSVDDKNRLTLPSKVLSKLSKNIYLSRGFEGCLEIRTEKDFEEYTKKLLSIPNTNSDIRTVKRIFLSSSAKIEIDSSNRILIPNILIEQASIEKDVIIIGLGDIVEIWSKDKYEKYSKSVKDKYETVADKIKYDSNK